MHEDPSGPVDLRGFTLTELAIVLGVIGTMLGGIWLAAGAVNSNMKTNQAITELQAITQNIRAMNGSRQNFSSAATVADQTAQFMTAGVFPNEMMPPGTPYPLNPWGGYVAIFIKPNSPQADNTQFEIAFYPDNVIGDSTNPTIPCGNLLTKTVGPNEDTGLVSVYDSAHNWRSPANAANVYLDSPDFVGCTGYVAWTFRLLN